MTRLFHRTTQDVLSVILADGFRDGEDGGVWFSPVLDCMGEAGRHLIVVDLNDSHAERITPYLRTAEASILRPGCGDADVDDESAWIDDPEGQRFGWYHIPADIANQFGTRRHIPFDQEWEL